MKILVPHIVSRQHCQYFRMFEKGDQGGQTVDGILPDISPFDLISSAQPRIITYDFEHLPECYEVRLSEGMGIRLMDIRSQVLSKIPEPEAIFVDHLHPSLDERANPYSKEIFKVYLCKRKKFTQPQDWSPEC